MTRLGELAAELAVPLLAASDEGPTDDPQIVDVTHDSRQVGPGSLFCCVKGEHNDGHDHALEAVAAGAVALLCEHRTGAGVPELLTEDVRRSMSRAAAVVWGRPSEQLRMIGVTGTNGKTTVVSMVRSIARSAGVRAEMIGTLTGARTTPESTDLQRLLATYVADGVQLVAMEVSSHALMLDRVADVAFDLGLFTNLGRDHLDFHQTPESYFAAKARLFESRLTNRGIVNVDDVHGRLLFDAAEIPMRPVSLGDVSAVVTTRAGTRFVWRGHEVLLPMIGAHNVANALLAATACVEIGIAEEAVVAGLAALEGVPGRFQIVQAPAGVDQPPYIPVVDYAHTPDALEATLSAARELAGPEHRVITVFGCGGDRDKEKRPLMGAVVARLADLAVVTSDNPRSEDPDEIIAQIVEGFSPGADDGVVRAELFVEPDRRLAIHAGLGAAREGDVVVVAGKGHETGQTIAGRTEPFDDREVVAGFLDSGAVG